MSLLKLFECKRRIGINTDDYDLLLLDLIDDVSAIIETYCGRHFNAVDYVEYQDGTGEEYFLTDEWPINSIASIYDDPDRVFSSSSLVDPTYYTYYANEGKVSLVATGSIIGVNLYTIFSSGRQNIKITYNAGYSTIPSDLKMIASEIMMKKFKNIQDKRIGITSVGSAGESIGLTLNDMLPDHKMILNAKYRLRGTE
jgi:hypothetical protein